MAVFLQGATETTAQLTDSKTGKSGLNEKNNNNKVNVKEQFWQTKSKFKKMHKFRENKFNIEIY